jgi:hypothetical protein
MQLASEQILPDAFPLHRSSHGRNKEDGKEIDNGISPSW